MTYVKPLYWLLLLLLLLSGALTLYSGDMPWDIVWHDALERMTGSSSSWNPLLDERIPRLIVIYCSGASLAVSGAVMQSLFRNPLASPSVMGISCGGSLAVILVFVYGLHFTYPYAIPMAAVGGALLTLLLVYSLSSSRNQFLTSNLILTGIAISTLLLAIQGVIMYALRNDWQLIQTLTEWEAGSTLDRSWKHVHMQLPLTIIGLAGSWVYRYELDIMALGEEEARSLGVEVNKVRWRLFLSVALLTGGTLASVGVIAFFGLVMPHLLRNIIGPANRLLIPFCILSGSVTLAVLDLMLRFSKIRIFTIGNISAIIGGLFFLSLLFYRKRAVRRRIA